MKPFTALKPKSDELFKFIRAIFSKKTLRRIVDELTSPDQSDGLKAFSAGLGIFLGILPVWGLQTVAAIFAALTFKLNKALVVIFSQVSFPPFLPLILYVSYRIGRFWTGSHSSNRLEQYLYGSITLAIAAGLMVGLTTYAALKVNKAARQYGISIRLRKSLQTQ